MDIISRSEPKVSRGYLIGFLIAQITVALLGLGLLGAIVWVAAHFIGKYW